MRYNITVFDELTGRILESHSSSTEIQLRENDTRPRLAEFSEPARHYVSGGAVVLRPELPVTLAGSTLAGVPSGATVTIDGVRYTADGSDIELSFGQPGVYAVTVECWPYLDLELEVSSEN